MTETAKKVGTREEVLAKLRAILADILVLNESVIKPESRLVPDLDADSIAFLELNYRLRQDFGLEVPEPKVDEELLRTSLVDGLRRMESMEGGITLFEFLKEDALRQEESDPSAQQRVVDAICGLMREEGFADRLKTALRPLEHADVEARAQMARMVAGLRRFPECQEALNAAAALDVELSTLLKQLEAGAPVSPPGVVDKTLSLWREMFAGHAAKGLFDLQVRHLAQFTGAAVPAKMTPDMPLNTLLVRDLFQFITVESYVRYILALASSQERIREMGGAAAVGRDLDARLRGGTPAA